MERSISICVGKGSLSHNNRKFIAKNVKADQTQNNVTFVKEDIKKVYHELFDEAQEAYNAKQKRKDKRVIDYYEKIRNGKQEKVFYEIIVQIGNKDDMNCDSCDGLFAKLILTDYIKSFQERNPHLRVFNAVLHMDEETPHLHIDFIPFTTGSTRGMSTRVSMKSALAQQGFVGKGKKATEWGMWAESERNEVEKAMQRCGYTRKYMDNHEEHLDVYDFKVKKRKEELKDLDAKVQQKELAVAESEKEVNQNDEAVKSLKNEIAKEQRNLNTLEVNKIVTEYEIKELKATRDTIQTEADKISKEILNLTEKRDKFVDEYDQQKKSLDKELIDTRTAIDAELEQMELVREIANLELEEDYNQINGEKKRLLEVKKAIERLRGKDSDAKMDKIIELTQENYDLRKQVENLKEQLERAYDFMKSKILNGINMFDEFMKTVGNRVRDIFHDKSR